MTHIVGLLFFDNSAGPPATGVGSYAQALQQGLASHIKPRNSEVIIPPNQPTNNFDVSIIVLDSGANLANYRGLANRLYNAERASVVVVADAAASRPTRAERETNANQTHKAMLSVVSADPEFFGHCGAGQKGAPNLRVTGVCVTQLGLNASRLAVLKWMVPNLTNIGIIRVLDPGADPNINHCADQEEQELRTAAPLLNLNVTQVVTIRPRPNYRNPDFTPIPNPGPANVGAYVVIRDPLFQYNRASFVSRVNGTQKPAMYPFRSFVEAGGLVSHGPDRLAGTRLAGRQLGMLLDRLDNGQDASTSGIPFADPPSIETVIKEATFAIAGAGVDDLPWAVHI
jgi:hypothetical protein